MRLFRKKFEALPHESAMRLLRVLAYGGSNHRRTMRQLAARAVESAPDHASRANAQAWATALQRGHRIRISTWPTKFYTGGETAAIDAELEEALEGIDVPPDFKGSEES